MHDQDIQIAGPGPAELFGSASALTQGAAFVAERGLASEAAWLRQEYRRDRRGAMEYLRGSHARPRLVRRPRRTPCGGRRRPATRRRSSRTSSGSSGDSSGDTGPGEGAGARRHHDLRHDVDRAAPSRARAEQARDSWSSPGLVRRAASAHRRTRRSLGRRPS